MPFKKPWEWKGWQQFIADSMDSFLFPAVFPLVYEQLHCTFGKGKDLGWIFSPLPRIKVDRRYFHLNLCFIWCWSILLISAEAHIEKLAITLTSHADATYWSRKGFSLSEHWDTFIKQTHFDLLMEGRWPSVVI